MRGRSCWRLESFLASYESMGVGGVLEIFCVIYTGNRGFLNIPLFTRFQSQNELPNTTIYRYERKSPNSSAATLTPGPVKEPAWTAAAITLVCSPRDEYSWALK